MVLEDEIFEFFKALYISMTADNPEILKEIIKANLKLFVKEGTVVHVTDIANSNISPSANINLTKLASVGKIGNGAVEITNVGLKSSSNFEIESPGTLTTGQHISQGQIITESTGGIRMKSANGHRWMIQISDTGQLIMTDLSI